MRHESVWTATADRSDFPRLQEGHGRRCRGSGGGGLVRLTTALLVRRAGAGAVAVVEAGRLGASTTGQTTRKVTSQHGWVYARLVNRHGEERARMHPELARRRAYLHPLRWTSLGLSLIGAMQIGMPVVCLAATETVEAVPPEAGLLSTNLDVLVAGLRDLVTDPERTTRMGKAAREYAMTRYGLVRFLADWDQLLTGLAR